MGRAKTSQFGTTTYQQTGARTKLVLEAAQAKHGRKHPWIALLLTVIEGPMGGGELKMYECAAALTDLDAILVEWGVPFEGVGPLRDMGEIMLAEAKARAATQEKREAKSAAERAAAGIE